MRPLVIALFLCFLLILTGCSKDDGKVNVEGTVTWNGQPLESGKITFLSPGKSSEAANIDHGSFSIRTSPGQKNIGVTAFKEISIKDERGDTPQVRDHQYIPHEYNENSDLVTTISETNEPVNFKLTGEEIPPPTNLDVTNRRPDIPGNSRSDRATENRRPR